MKQTLQSGLVIAERLGDRCAQVRFNAGDVLRREGEHYRETLLLTTGQVQVTFDRSGKDEDPIVVGEHEPIGEIGFLRGTAANATVTALSPVTALVIDDHCFAQLEADDPGFAAQLQQFLARKADDRQSYNLAFEGDGVSAPPLSDVEILLCRNEELLRQAQKLRYDVYCRELGRASPHADHDLGILSDGQDDHAHVFIAVKDGRTLGTIRALFSKEAPLGAMEDLYGMAGSRLHPHATGISNKFIVRREARRSPVAVQLIAGLAQFSRREDIQECYMDCIPALLPYYRAMGFKIAGPAFYHVENGPSVPLKIDLTRHYSKLCSGASPWRLLTLYMKAKAIKLAHKLSSRHRYDDLTG